MITDGLLAQVGPWKWESGKGFYLVWSERTELSPEARSVRDWIIGSSQ